MLRQGRDPQVADVTAWVVVSHPTPSGRWGKAWRDGFVGAEAERWGFKEARGR